MCVVSMNGVGRARVGRALQYSVLHIVTTVRPADNLITDIYIEKSWIDHLSLGESHETLGKFIQLWY